jgi:hypothetical protein
MEQRAIYRTAAGSESRAGFSESSAAECIQQCSDERYSDSGVFKEQEQINEMSILRKR